MGKAAENEKDTNGILDEFTESVTVLHGIFSPKTFDDIVRKSVRDVFVLEGRPSLESAQFSCRELIKRKVKPTLIADNMAGFLFYKNLVKEVWISYQVADEDGALCQIGALILGVLGKRHSVPVRLFPSSQRLALLGKDKEILYFNGVKVAPRNVKGYVPLAEWVPRKYISEIVKEK
ncbi:MAG: hypothetical protein KC900_10515 [Candidatus Omnitrophica bacterium]|nr:hypothetical protein [Candidatus Omnitrophota bacterium]